MLPTLLSLALTAPKVNHPPAIAKVAGITLGLTTAEEFERKYGKAGYVTEEGRRWPGRAWYDQTSGTLIMSLRSRKTKDGTIIDDLSIGWTTRSKTQKTVTTIHLPPSSLGLLTKVKQKMSLRQLEAAFATKLPRQELVAKGLVQYPANLIDKRSDRYTEWKVDFVFSKSMLSGFQVFAD